VASDCSVNPEQCLTTQLGQTWNDRHHAGVTSRGSDGDTKTAENKFILSISGEGYSEIIRGTDG